jgi:hypothetical protein
MTDAQVAKEVAKEADKRKRNRIRPSDIATALREDDEFALLLKDVNIIGSARRVAINRALLPENSQRAKAVCALFSFSFSDQMLFSRRKRSRSKRRHHWSRRMRWSP